MSTAAAPPPASPASPASSPRSARPTRRGVVVAGGVGASALLAACSGDGETEPAGDATGTAAGAGDASEAAAGDPTGESAEGVVASLADVPVGGGVVLEDEGLVLTQPEAGTVRGFDVTCPHQGCAVASVSDGLIRCPCHGSAFAVADGTVQNGPATTGLTEVGVSVDGEDILLS